MQADVLIVTVTKTESQAVLQVFPNATGYAPKPVSLGDKIYHDLGIIKGASVFMVQSEMGAGGLGAAQQTVQKGIAALSPPAVMMVGIAFGVDAKKQSIGDILVSQRLLLYDLQRVSMDKEGMLKLIPRGDRPHASAWLFNRLQSADLYWPKSNAKVRFGLILSGEKLVDNIDFRQQLRDLEPEAIGGEMEGAGLYVACQDKHVDWILVKAICDWADGHKDRNRDKRQQLAAHNAASFLLHALQLAPLKKEIPKGPIRDTGKDDVRTSVARIGVNQDASRTYFYVPDGDSNRYPNLHEYEHHSYSIFLFELNISADGIRIHAIRAFVYHPSFQEWTELEDARQTYLQSSRLPETTEYLERHMKVHSAFAPINIQSNPVVISFAKYGSHYKSLEHGYGHRLPVALVLHINTSYLYLFLEVPEMGTGQAFILDYKIFDSFGTEILEHWVSQPGWPLESRQRRRVIEISEAMP
jgi:nucleoside phosphorylase